MIKVRIKDRNADGRGRAPHGRGQVLVAGAHPGEEVLVEVDRRTAGTWQGRVATLLRRDPLRLENPCPHEFRCTGCALLGTSREQERDFKEGRLKKLLADLPGPLPKPRPMLTPGPLFGYRSLAKWVLFRRRGRLCGGSYVEGTHLLANNHGCPVLLPALAALMDGLVECLGRSGLPVHRAGAGKRGQGLRYLLGRMSMATGESLVVLASSSGDRNAEQRVLADWARQAPALGGAFVLGNQSPGNVLLKGQLTRVAGRGWIEERLLGHPHRLGPLSFFQVNIQGAARLCAATLELAGQGRLCLETHAGVGAMSLPLTSRFERVVALEAAPEAAASLARAAAESHGRLRGIHGRAETDLAALLDEGPEALVMDPPRAGLGISLCRMVGAARVPRLVLLSCKAESLVRDLRELLGLGFRVRVIQPLDLFPRTARMETVTLLERVHG